jgi:hypothetical protein
MLVISDSSLCSFILGKDASTCRQTPARKHYRNPFSRESLHSKGQGDIISGSKYFPIRRMFLITYNSLLSDDVNLKLWKSLSPGRSVSLSKFTVQQNLKNRPGALIGQENEQGYVIHYALLVCCFFFGKPH